MDQMDFFPLPYGHQEGRENEERGQSRTEYKNKRKLSRLISKRDWVNAVELCNQNPKLLWLATTNSKDTALHVAINDNSDDVVKQLIGIMEDNNIIDQALKAQNNKKENPLHCAAARGSVQMCELILSSAGSEMGRELLVMGNKWNENPIFVAVIHNRKDAFIYLYDAASARAYSSYDLYRYLVLNKFPDDEDETDGDETDGDGSDGDGTDGDESDGDGTDGDESDGDGTDGDTVLHSAIRREHLELAFIIIQKCPELSHSFNTSGMAPLELLARTPSVFKSSYNLSWWKHFIYFCIQVDPLKYDPNPTAETRPDRNRSSGSNYPPNYLLCRHFCLFFDMIVRRIKKIVWPSNSSDGEARTKGQHPYKREEEGEPVNQSFPQNYATCYEFLAFVYLNLLGMMGLGNIFTNIKRVKQKYKWNLQILDQLLEIYSNIESMETKPEIDLESGAEAFEMFAEFGGDDDDINKVESITNKALLAAAETGVIEVVNKILRRFPEIITEDTVGKSNRNILMVAVENQQAEIFLALHLHLKQMSGKPNLWNDLVHAVDQDDNTILHIAAKYDESLPHGWQAYGSAMQMQCEVTWYEYVKKFVPSHFLFLKNKKKGGKDITKKRKGGKDITKGKKGGKDVTKKKKKGGKETPVQIFRRCHKDMVEKGSAWLKDTSQSCSVVAALVAGVSFATSRSIPGSTDARGKPTLEGHPAFQVFAISGLMGLGFSVTALIMFLAILTSRKQPIDFQRNLPLKLLLGLSSLFVSIASMFVSFCASHFFVLEDKFKKGIFPLYAVTCLPISFYAIAQFPLYLDLLKAIVKHVPQSQKYVQL